MGYKVFDTILLAVAITIAAVFIAPLPSVIESLYAYESELVEEIPTVIVRITDKNNVIHSREGMLLDGVVTVELSGK